MTKIKVVSKPEKKTSSKGNVYYSFKARGEDGLEHSGNLFSEKEPVLDQELEVDERYSEQYQNYSWYEKKEKRAGFGGGFSKPGLSIEQQIRLAALQQAVQLVTSEFAPEEAHKVKIKDLAASFEQFIIHGKGGAQ